MCFNGVLCHGGAAAALIKRQLVCFLVALKYLGLYKLHVVLTRETLLATQMRICPLISPGYLWLVEVQSEGGVI